MKNTRWIMAAILLCAGAASAFIYANDNTLLWAGSVDGNWDVNGNWDNIQGADLGVPGGNNAYACIDSGTANITSGSYPTGQVSRAYIGGTGGATLNVSTDTSWGRFYTSWETGETGTVNLTAGTMTMNDTRFYLGNNGNSQFTMSGGALNASEIHLASGNTAVSSMEISGGSLDASRYLWLRAGTATLTVNGSVSSITVDRFLVDSGNDHALKLGLDAGGVTTINVDGEVSGGSSYEGATLNDLTIEVDALPGFTGGAGSTYDIFRSVTYITTAGLAVTDSISGFDFTWAIVTDGGDQVLRLTAVPVTGKPGLFSISSGMLLMVR